MRGYVVYPWGNQTKPEDSKLRNAKSKLGVLGNRRRGMMKSRLELGLGVPQRIRVRPRANNVVSRRRRWRQSTDGSTQDGDEDEVKRQGIEEIRARGDG